MMRVRRPIVWLLILGAPVLLGAIAEGLALADPEGLTLSQFVVDVTERWRPLIFLAGAVTGGLVVHFWWPWVPRQRRVMCGRCGETILRL